ncbi:glycosyl hydrolase family 28 protein [uncultured Bacteroides sp.]|uniref:glycoside hydrolase family 28 protein n=1 Tax=uncultured Bacteroides sp. TaxID=162156 RepID=UPI002AA8985F|nr:glycosyl hydrolase family 28 protein [uncultured Bacteroides sp.]
MKKIIIASLAALCLCGCGSLNKNSGDIPSFDWLNASERGDLSWAKEVGSRQFPKDKIFRVKAFGAVNDSTVLSTLAIQRTIDSCSNAGGGIVAFEPGYYQTGALFIKKGVNLQIGKGVTLLASTNFKDYPEFRTRIAGIEMVWPSAVLNIMDAENAAVSGEGTLDCRGKFCWDKYRQMRKDYEGKGLRWIVDYDCKRIRGILISNSSDVTLKNFTLIRSGFWGVQVLYSTRCTLNGLTINNNIGGHGPSTDGIDIDSSTRILLDGCDINCNDDNICLKAGRDADGLRVNRPTEYVVVRNCIARKGAGLITCGSETSGNIRYVLGYNLKAYGTSSTLKLKSAMNRGGTVDHIYMTDVIADSVQDVLAVDLNWNPSYSYSELPEEYKGKDIPEHWKVMLTPVVPPEKGYPHFKDVYLANVKATHATQFISTSGWSDSLKLDSFAVYHLDVEAQKAGIVVFTNHFRMNDVKLKIADKSEVTFKNNTELTKDIRYE